MVTIADNTLKKLVLKAFTPIIAWKKKFKVGHPQSDASKALGLVSTEDCEIASRVKSHDTILGKCLQNLVILIAHENPDTFEVVAQEKPTGQATDVILISDDATYILFVQSQKAGKNGDGNKAIKNKMRKKHRARGIVAIVNGESFRNEIGNVLRLQGPRLIPVFD